MPAGLRIVEPSAKASVVDKADYVELCALAAHDGNYSFADFQQDLRRSGALELMDEDDPDSDSNVVDAFGEDSESLSDAVYQELADRELACGGHYPFELESNLLQLRVDSDVSASRYLFFLFLSCFGNNGPTGADATRIFEDLSATAARRYFGYAPGGADNDHIGLYRFGAPRRHGEPSAFHEALTELCVKLGEGAGPRSQGNIADQKDSKLDLVVWKAFADRRAGKLVGFGQCATGQNWKSKVSELNAVAFCKTWFMQMPPVDPVTMFFVPFRIGGDEWFHVANNAGVVFDRCRLTRHLDHASQADEDAIRAWNSHVMQSLTSVPA